MHPLAPLLILLTLLLIIAGVGYIAYTIANDVATTTNNKMQRKNVIVTKDGMKVGVKEVREERYVDSTQNFLVKAWNYSSWPAYKSRFWNKEEQQQGQVQQRNPYSRSHSTSSASASKS